MGRMQHLGVVIEYVVIVAILEVICGGIRIVDNPAQHIDPIKTYGFYLTYIIYAIKAFVFLAVPFVFANVIGILSMNTYPRKPVLKGAPLLDQCICVRIVTRGEYPALVLDNVKRNLETCLKVGVEKFVIEVVTDKSIGLPFDSTGRVKETVVPKSYTPARGALYKARALNYCLEKGVNTLADEDYIVHLDEETLLTESSVIGIVNFIRDGKHTLGQGSITYANENIVNQLTTLMDCIRVAVDYGMFRLTLGVLHRPIFSWKGSFVVTKVAVERDITFDHGPRGSIAEDCYFALIAFKKGYTFDWIEGEMWEKSTFTLMDFIRQRKRWLQGLILAFCSEEIPARCKIGIFFNVASNCCMLIGVLNSVLPFLLPIPTWQWFDALCGSLGAGMGFFFIFGAQKSFNRQRLGTCKYIFKIICVVLIIPLAIICEGTASVMAVFSSKMGFHVVSKTLPGQKGPSPLNV